MKRFRLFWVLALVIALSGCSASGEGDREMRVVVTSFPLYELVREVAGDADALTMLVRPGTDTHMFEPTPADVMAVMEADVFFYVGGASDGWVADQLASAGEGLRVVRLMDAVEALEDQDEHRHASGEQEDIGYDEHIWTSPVNMRSMLSVVEKALSEAYPARAEAFQENMSRYDQELEALDAAFREVVQSAKRRELVFADRFPFLYFAREYGLTYRSAFNGCSEEVQPSVQAVASLIQAVEEDGVPAVYVIELSTGDIARAIQEETGVEIVKMHSCQNVSQQEFEEGQTYLSLMWGNVEALKAGLW